MKWIGQHIWDFISRFRSDVYLESIDSGTIASGSNLGLDSNNKIVKDSSGLQSNSAISIEAVGDTSDISIITAHTGGTAFHLDADANAGSVVDIDAGELDIDVTTSTNITSGTNIGINATTAINLNSKQINTFHDFNDETFEGNYSDDVGYGHILRYSPDSNQTLDGSTLYYLEKTGVWTITDADAVATGASQLLGIGTGASARTVGVLIKGFIRIAYTEILNIPGSGEVDGLPIYVSTTPGHFDFTAPSGTGDFVRIVGYAIDDHNPGSGTDVLIYFDPDKTWVERA